MPTPNTVRTLGKIGWLVGWATYLCVVCLVVYVVCSSTLTNEGECE